MSHREKQLKKSAVRVVESDLGVIDLPYLLLTLLLVAIGLLVLFSASYARAYYETKNAASVFVNQLIFAVMGIGVMWLISRVPYEWYQKLSLLILAASIGLLVLVPFIGTESGGATRWLDFGFVSFQPSEIAKFGVICSFAAIMAAHTRDMKTIRYGVAPYVVILGIIAVLLYLEPHMSATLIILALGFILMTLGGTDWKYLVGLVILGCLLVAVYLLTKGYTGGRISAWLHPENDPLDKGLQVLQSQYAIGSGGLLGLGFGRGRQKYLYLPEEHNDYIFAIACEELGFVGAIGILILVRSAHHPRLLDCHACARPLLHAAGRRPDDASGPAGGPERRCCDESSALHGHFAAVLLLWRNRAHHAARRKRHRAECVAQHYPKSQISQRRQAHEGRIHLRRNGRTHQSRPCRCARAARAPSGQRDPVCRRGGRHGGHSGPARGLPARNAADLQLYAQPEAERHPA